MSANDYEDNVNFCRERYEDAKLACEVLFAEIYDKEAFLNILFPTADNVKLNPLRKYSSSVLKKNELDSFSFFRCL